MGIDFLLLLFSLQWYDEHARYTSTVKARLKKYASSGTWNKVVWLEVVAWETITGHVNWAPHCVLKTIASYLETHQLL